MLKFIPMVFRIDKCGVMLNVIICTLLILVLGGRKVVPIGQLKGDN